MHLISSLKSSYFFSLMTVAFFTLPAYSQKTEADTELKYLKNSDQSRTLTYTVKYTKPEEKKSTFANDLTITFFSNEGKEVIGTAKTNGYGTAQITLPSTQKITASNGQYCFTAAINENSLIEIKRDSLMVTDLFIEMSLELKDTVKTIVFHTFELNQKGEKQPVKTDLVFYVPRTFSKLKVAEASSGEDGNGEIEFPEGIPGDSIGNLTVLGRVEENEKYATVETTQTKNWGVPTNYHIAKFRRALWTSIAPTWMIITLTVLLLGVWGHYMYVVYKLYKINKEGKQLS